MPTVRHVRRGRTSTIAATVASVIQIVDRLPSPSDYQDLRRAVRWRVPDDADTRRALDATVAARCAVEGDHVVGMGRIVGDRAFYLFVVDLVVHPDHQGRQLGSRLLADLEAEAARISATGTISVVADLDVAAFYEHRGFERATSALLTKAIGPTSGDLPQEG